MPKALTALDGTTMDSPIHNVCFHFALGKCQRGDTCR